MAVYTDVSDDELRAFLAAYDIGAVLSLKGIAEGVENSNFLLRTETGQFILTLYEKRVSEQDLPFFLTLLEHLYARGITCPLPVRDRQGSALSRLAGKPAAICTFLDGISVRRPAARQCGLLGEALARLHLAGADFEGKRANALSIDGWRPLYERAAARADTVQPGLAAETARALGELEQAWPHGLPGGIIHADLFPDNVFFLGDRISGLIDFYFACNDAYAYDLAVCLNAWAFEPDYSFNLTKARALFAGYERVRTLSDVEISAFPVLAQGAALRFMLTRLVDWLNVPPGALVKPHDPLAYYRRVRFHRQQKTTADYGRE
jgi:homoserine kinase type II